MNIPTTVGANTAYAGFTGATGGYTSNQNILSWTMSSASGGGGTVATPTFSPAAGTYLGTQTVTLSDTTSGATIFYTLDGSQPGTSAGGSTQQYSGPLTVSSTETIKALGDRFRDDHQRNGQCDIHHRIAGGHAYILAGRWQLYLSANGEHLDDIIGSDDLLHDEWINADNQFNGIQRANHGEREQRR